MSRPSVALAGATGNLGPAILQALLEVDLKVTVLTRRGSSSSSTLAAHPNLTVRTVDYGSLESLVTALKGVNVVISVLASTQISQQKHLIDAAIAAGVSRFLPSEFGSNLGVEKTRALPVFAEKVEIQEYIKDKVKQNPGFSYTFFYNSAFLDWGIKAGFFINVPAHKATLYDGGNTPTSFTRLSTIGKGVAAVVAHLDITKNQEVYIHDGALTQNQLIEAVKSVDGKEWTTTTKDLGELEREVRQTLASSGGKDFHALIGFLFLSIFGKGYGGDFEGFSWNQKLGLPELSSAELQRVVVNIVKNL